MDALKLNFTHVRAADSKNSSRCLSNAGLPFDPDEAIKDTLQKKEVKKILFDCTQLNYISSAGLGVFMSYIRDFENKKIKHVIFGLSDKVKSVFEILGLDKLLHIVKTKEEASVLTNGL